MRWEPAGQFAHGRDPARWPLRARGSDTTEVFRQFLPPTKPQMCKLPIPAIWHVPLRSDVRLP